MCGKFGGFAGFFRALRIEAQTFLGKFRSIFRATIRASEKIFRASSALQTCHPISFCAFSSAVMFSQFSPYFAAISGILQDGLL